MKGPGWSCERNEREFQNGGTEAVQSNGAIISGSQFRRCTFPSLCWRACGILGLRISPSSQLEDIREVVMPARDSFCLKLTEEALQRQRTDGGVPDIPRPELARRTDRQTLFGNAQASSTTPSSQLRGYACGNHHHIDLFSSAQITLSRASINFFCCQSDRYSNVVDELGEGRTAESTTSESFKLSTIRDDGSRPLLQASSPMVA